MAWIYLAESEGYPSPSENGYYQKPTVKTTSTLNPSYFRECLRVNFIRLRYGMTSGPLMEKASLRSTLYSEASPVRISVLQDLERAWRESGQDCFLKSYDLLAKFDRDLFSWKMSQLSLLEEESELLLNLPSYGMTVGGQLYQPEMLEPITSASDGFCLPTPMARDWKDWNVRGGRLRASPQIPLWLCRETGYLPTVALYELLMSYPSQWTELKDWAMRWFRSKPKKLLKSSLERDPDEIAKEA